MHLYFSVLPFSPSESALFAMYKSAATGTVRIISGQPSRWPAELATLRGHQTSVTSVVFSPDGERLATGSDDHSIRLWDSNTGSLISILQNRAPVPSDVVFSSNGKRLASICYNSVHLWDGVSGVLISTLDGHEREIGFIAFSRDGTRLVSICHERIVRLWNGSTGSLIAIPKIRPGNTPGGSLAKA